MTEPDLSQRSSHDLSRLFDLADAAGSAWNEEEFGAVLRHQLATRLATDLAQGDPSFAERLDELVSNCKPVIETFGDLLTHPQPPMELLEATKRWARHHGSQPDSPLPHDVTRVVYLAAIAAARLRHDARITKQDDASLQTKLAWARDLEWLEPSLQTLLREAEKTIKGGDLF